MHVASQHPFGQVGPTGRRVRRVALLVCFSASVLLAAAGSAAATTYSVTDLGSLGFGTTYGVALNDNGQVTGYSYLSNTFQVPCPPQKYGQPKKCVEHPSHAFFWSNGTMTDLGTLGGHFSQGNSINLSGEVVGSAELSSGLSDGFLWDGRKLVDLGSFHPTGVNDSGEIAGNCASGPCVLAGGKFTQLPDPPGLSCSAESINNSGEVLGGCGDTSSYLHGVVWENGSAIDIGTLGGPQTGPAAINNLGQVTGWSQTSTDADHGFIWSNGKMTALGLNFFPAAINDSGVVVGGSEIYSNGSFQNLNTMLPAGSPQVESAAAINDNGQIVASNGGEALLLTP